MMEVGKEKSRAGTVVDGSLLVGRLKDHLAAMKRFRVPALNFSFRRSIRSFRNAMWLGHTLPFQLRIDGEVDRETLVGRLSFAALFIVSDSMLLLGRFGWWLLKKVPWRINAVNALVVGGLIVGFLGWGFPLFLEELSVHVEQTKTIQMIREIPVLSVPEVEVPPLGGLGFLPLIGMIGAVPFSVWRFRRFRGLKSVVKKESKPIIGDDE